MDCDQSLLAALRAGGVTAYVEMPTLTAERFEEALPFVVATPLPGVTADARRHEVVPYSIQSYAARRDDARSVFSDARDALIAAWGKTLNHIEVDTIPAPVPSGRDGVWCHEVTWTVSVRSRA